MVWRAPPCLRAHSVSSPATNAVALVKGMNRPCRSTAAKSPGVICLSRSTRACSAAPGAAIFLVSLAFNLLGDGLRDALDPKGVK